MADQTAPLELPIGVTENQVLQQLARIESQVRKISNEVAANFVKSNAKVAASFRPITTEAQGMSRSTVASLQNVSYQLQDIFVQIQGGQGVTRALGQQMPQLLSGFGAFGAAAGLASAALIPLVASLISTGEEALGADEAMKQLEGAFKAYSSYVKTATTDTSALIEEYKSFAGRIRETSKVLAEGAIGDVRSRAKAALEPIKGELAEIQNLASQIAAQQTFVDQERASPIGDPMAIQQAEQLIIVLREQVDSLAASFGLSASQAQVLASKIDASLQANTFEEMASKGLEVIETFDDMGLSLANIPSDALRETLNYIQQFSEGAARATVETNSLNDQLNNAKLALMDIIAGAPQAGWLSGAISDASLLTQKLWKAVTAASAVWAKQNAPNGLDAAGNPVQDGVSSGNRPQAAPSGRGGVDWGTPKASGRSGGGAKRQDRYQSAVTDIQGETKAILDQIAAYSGLTGSGATLATQIAIIEEKQKLLNAAQKAGMTVTPEMSAQMEQLAADYVNAKEQLQGMQDAAQTGEAALTDLFGSILEGSDSAKKAVANLLAEIAKIQFAKGLMGLLGAAGGGGVASWLGGLLSPNANGGVYSGAGISAYSGKVVSKPTVFPFAKGVGLMGEAGPEAIMPLTRINGRLGVRAQGGGGSSKAEITINVEGAKGNTEIEQMVAQGISQGLASYDKALPGRVQQINTSPRRR